MYLQLVNEKKLSDEATELRFKTIASELQFIGYVLEAHEGWCNFTTIDRENMILMLIVPKDFLADTKKLIDQLRQYPSRIS